MNTDWSQQSFLDNNMNNWLIAFGIIVGGLILKRFVSHQLSDFYTALLSDMLKEFR